MSEPSRKSANASGFPCAGMTPIHATREKTLHGGFFIKIFPVQTFTAPDQFPFLTLVFEKAVDPFIRTRDGAKVAHRRIRLNQFEVTASRSYRFSAASTMKSRCPLRFTSIRPLLPMIQSAWGLGLGEGCPALEDHVFTKGGKGKELFTRPADPEILLNDCLWQPELRLGFLERLVTSLWSVVGELIHVQACATICCTTGCIQAGTYLICLDGFTRSLSSSARAGLPIT